MIKRLLHIVISTWLSFLLLFGSTTMDFVHSFAGHDDTVDVSSKHSGPALESEHHHCAFLGFALAPFADDSSIPLVFFSNLSHSSVYNAVYQPGKFRAYTGQHSLRGPPVVA